MDRRHGKRPLPSETSEEKSKGRDEFAAAATSWTEAADMTAMVTALTQVMGSDEQLSFQQSPKPSSVQSEVKNEPAVQDQGIYIHIYGYSERFIYLKVGVATRVASSKQTDRKKNYVLKMGLSTFFSRLCSFCLSSF